ncbi:WG repeat-containing protein [Caldicellulosiruptor sp. DIB 104C]|uniref:WG repeat-containing protein n=1 Tax=Caldicellulosiruptor sp. DIB 104C TaxID=3019889 RepID=UPI002306A78A|nr:WG repeat-containing protein [Caldicellulosiruptor sp. DIB 104C]
MKRKKKNKAVQKQLTKNQPKELLKLPIIRSLIIVLILSLVVFIIYGTTLMVVKRNIADQFFAVSNESYQNVAYINSKLAMFEKNGKWGVMDIKGKIIAKPIYERILLESEGMIPVKIRNKWGFIDIHGKIRIKPQFDNVSAFTNQLAAVCINNRWGIIDKSGNFTIKPQYQDIIIHPNKMIQAKKQNKWGIIDKKGNQIIPFKYNEVQILNYKGVFVAKEKSNYKVISIANKKESKENYSNYSLNIGKLLPVFRNHKWGLLNLETLSELCPPIYDEIWVHNEGWFELKKDKKLHIMFSDGKMLPKNFKRDSVVVSSNKIISIKQNNGVVTLLNLNTRKTIDIKAQDISVFNNGLAAVKVKEKWGLITEKGEYVIKPKYDSIWIADKDIIVTYLDKKWGIVKTDGKVLIPPKYDLIGEVKDEYIAFLKNGKWGVMKKTGKILLKPKFDQIVIHKKNYIFAKQNDIWFLIVIVNNKKYFYKFKTFSVMKINDNIWAYTIDKGMKVIILKK